MGLPEYPDITVYIEALDERIVGRELLSADLHSPFLLRSVEPPLEEFVGRTVLSLERLGKRIALGFDTGSLYLTDPRLFDGIGNAYSDEILHRARLSPIAMSL